MDQFQQLYGVVDGQNSISFVLSGFQCKFFDPIDNRTQKKLLVKPNGFVIGRTYNGKYVYIYLKNDKLFSDILTVNMHSYIVCSDSELWTFKSVSFYGGILNKLFYRNSLRIRYDDTQCTQYFDDSHTYRLNNTKLKGSLRIGSSVSESMSVENGTSIT